nr:glycosyltransferase family 9 protein [Iningainema tapete]
MPWARSFVERFNHYLDEFLEFPGYPGIPEISPPHKLPEFLTSVQQQRFDLALQMHGSGIVSNTFTTMLGASVNAGFYLPGNYEPDPDYFLPYPTNEPEVWRHLRLIEYLGIPLQGDELEFPLTLEDFSSLQNIDEASSLRKGEYVCVHPGASVPEKCWSVEKFAAIADAIAERGFQIVLTGTAPEANLTQTLAAMMRTKPINLAGRTSLGAMAALLSSTALLVCNDTGVSHLAAALRVKSIVIFTNSELHRWAPLNRDLHRVLCSDSVVIGTAEARRTQREMVMAHVEELLTKEVVNVT